MKVIVTGADGFLGWHLRARLHALTDHDVVPVDLHNWHQLKNLTRDADAVLHLAGINRADERELEDGNAALAADLAAAVTAAPKPPRVVYANSVQVGNGTPYGRGKEKAARILADATRNVGSNFVDVLLPNLFGEHGRPNYNSFVATFTDKVVAGEEPGVNDAGIRLLHAQSAAQCFIDALAAPSESVRPDGTLTTVRGVLDTLRSQFLVYQRGEIPPLHSELDVGLFNTLRAAMFPHHYPISLVKRTDPRGSLVETVRAHGGEGQTFISTTKPGVTRGQHFHMRKVERFVVVGGSARIELRRVLHRETVSFAVTGEAPVIVDMPTLWAHKIVNTGTTELTTMFWTNELYDPDNSDTYPEEV